MSPLEVFIACMLALTFAAVVIVGVNQSNATEQACAAQGGVRLHQGRYGAYHCYAVRRFD